MERRPSVLTSSGLGPALFLLLVGACIAERDHCQGPVVQLTVPGSDARFYGVFAPFGAALALNESLVGPLAHAAPQDACTPLQGKAYADAVVLVQRGACSFTDKARSVQEARGAAMVLFDNQPGCVSMGFENKSLIEDITIPSISVSQHSGEALVALVDSQPQPPKVTLQPVDLSGLDGSALVLLAMAVGTVVGGSLWAGHDYLLSKKPGRDAGEVPLLQGPVSANEVVDITAVYAVAFIVGASCVLLLLFFFLSEAFFYVLLVLFSLASLQSLTITLAALLRMASPSLNKHITKLPQLGPCPTVALVALPFAAAIVVTWAVMRDADWSWTLQDVQGICLMLLIFRTLRLNSIKVSSILLSLAFCYDVFWVFIQPWLFSGPSVMVQVAEGGGTHENLPMLLRVPYLGLPSELGAYSMLGFGDIILPGLLVAYMRRVDLDLHLGPLSSYFVPTCAAYAAGLVLTYVALLYSWFGDQGQPALLYLVPCTLGTVLLLGYLRRDLPALWLGTTRRYSKLEGDEPRLEAVAVAGGGAGVAGATNGEADVERAGEESALLSQSQRSGK